MNIISI